MKADFYEIIIERPRSGSRDGHLLRRRNRRVAKQVDPDSAPSKSSMGSRRQYGWNGKSLNENLRPLERFLATNVGRPWANVYSEIREHLNLNSAVQYHVVQHLRWMVNNDVVMSEDGKPMRPSGRYGSKREFEELYSSHRPMFYVHPVNGLLCTAPRRPDKKKNDDQKIKVMGTEVEVAKANGVSYLKVDGVWYEPKLAVLPKTGPAWAKPATYKILSTAFNDYGPNDVIFGKVGMVMSRDVAQVIRIYGSAGVYCVGKKQLNSKELKRLGLVNDEAAAK